MLTKRYIVGTRDTTGRFRAVRIEGVSTLTEAKIAAVSRLERDGVYAIATNAHRINALGERISC